MRSQLCKIISTTCLCSLLLVGLAACDNSSPPPGQAGASGAVAGHSVLDRVKNTGVLRVGYAIYEPYLSEDPNTKHVSGLSVDLLNRIVKEWGRPVRVEWVRTTWDTMKSDLAAGKFDLMVEPIFRTPPRAAEVGFTRPYSYFGYCVGVVRIDENRFNTLNDVNRPGITVAVTQGVTDHEYARTHLTRVPADLLKVMPSGNIENTLVEVLLGKADIALADVPTVQRFVAAHKDKVKAIFIDNPPAVVAAGFMAPQGDHTFIAFLNVCLDYLDDSGELERLSRQYNVPYYRVERKRVGGP